MRKIDLTFAFYRLPDTEVQVPRQVDGLLLCTDDLRLGLVLLIRGVHLLPNPRHPGLQLRHAAGPTTATTALLAMQQWVPLRRAGLPPDLLQVRINY